MQHLAARYRYAPRPARAREERGIERERERERERRRIHFARVGMRYDMQPVNYQSPAACRKSRQRDSVGRASLGDAESEPRRHLRTRSRRMRPFNERL